MCLTPSKRLGYTTITKLSIENLSEVNEEESGTRLKPNALQPYARSRRRTTWLEDWCRREDSNLHALTGTTP